MSFRTILVSAVNKRHFHAAKEGRKAFTVRAYVRQRNDGSCTTNYGNAIHCGPLDTRAKPASRQHAEAYRVRVIPK